MTTTSHGHNAQTGSVRLRILRVKLDLIDCPTEALAGSRRLPDFVISDECANAVMALRPPILMEVKADGQPTRYRAIHNADALRWFVHANKLSHRTTQQVRSLVLSVGSVAPDTIDLIDRYLIPLVFGEFGDSGQRQARRKLKAAGIVLSGPDPTRRLRPMTQL